ncbi:MAG: ABC-2 transporter permease [Syntrophomonas sp.]|uniref:ABC-2 transporter permease n=1 Tax=Syntrophomonas sp. TaxID=2053627 RepID=UPI002631C4E8|nr:ABC-2 transporter permease [Syntrophomonas sp.]MDD2510481.1 ABC-2 transporter permease [Syntrophomonas sp.]MDD3880172.1 ABC-2 transporter permease [Syntrophomonas sp.]MDD4627009.1 ABC-2 transporter permease [Syntrophomonas sp.]
MFKLLLKDLLVLKSSIIWAMTYLLAIIVIFSMTPPFDKFIYIMAGYGATYILIMGTLMAEFKNQSDILLNSLPVKRHEIILSKYLTTLVLTLLALAVAAILGLIINLLPLPLSIRLMSGMDAAIVLLMAALTLTIVMPVNLIFSNQAARVAIVMVFMLLFFAPVWIKGFIMDRCEAEWAQVLINTAVSQPAVLLSVGAGLLLFLLALSLIISLRWYEARDF